MVRHKGGFVKNRYKLVSEVMKKRFSTVQSFEHSYASQTQPDIYNVAKEVVLSDDGNQIGQNDSWREGRRVVDLGVLADALSSCVACAQPLQLNNTQSITTYGLSAILKITCTNTKCMHINNVPTGKRHGANIWDANSKLATAMIHAGVGERRINSILAALNIPTVSHRMLDERQKEVGEVMKKVANKSVDTCLKDEVAATFEKTSNSRVTASVDAGWQKRGSGNAYNSLSGHCSMIGKETGKIIGYAVRCKTCRQCSKDKEFRKITSHKCMKNWDGSSKSMEQDMIKTIVESNIAKGVETEAIIGDDDTSTISLLHRTVDNSIKKISDKNHMKKLIGNNLYSLKKKHKRLSSGVIKYIQKCLNYVIAQNHGNSDGIKKGLTALSKHPFGDHSDCSENWCRFIQHPSSSYKSLPSGKPLNDISLQADLTTLFGSLMKQSSKLANLDSTQPNESFNKTVASKAPKTHHYSGSSSLNYRVAASVSQKNIGQQYVVEVNREMNLSPGKHTNKATILLDMQSRKRKALTITRKAKLRRLQLKAKRSQNTSQKETMEGKTYSTGLGLVTSQTVESSILPSPTSVKLDLSIACDQQQHIYFDLEATGFERNSHITQIAALKPDGAKFSCFVMPKCKLAQKASEVTGITVKDGNMFQHGHIVDAVSISNALDRFIHFISHSDRNVLVGHNIKSYDCPILFNALQSCNRISEFEKYVCGFIDTLKFFKFLKPGLKSYSQVNLVLNFLGETYSAHDAQVDVHMLRKLVLSSSLKACKELVESSFSLKSALRCFQHSKEVQFNLPSLTHLVENKTISISMAKKIAGSGLNFNHLKLAYERSGREGISAILTEPTESSCPTKSNRIIDALSQHLQQLEE